MRSLLTDREQHLRFPRPTRLSPFFLFSLFPGLLVLTATGCGNRGAAAPVWLAHVATLSGPDKDAGESAARGLRLAVDEINKEVDQGQGTGRPVKVIHSDTRGKLEAFEAEAIRLVTINRVSFLFGGTNAEQVERLDRAQATVVTPTGMRSRGLSEAVYFTGIPPSQQGKALARFAIQELNADSVLLVQDERREEFLEIAEAFARELPLVKKDAKAPLLRRLPFGKDAKAGELAKALQERLKQDAFKAIVFAGRADDLRDLGPLPVPVLFAGDEGSGKAILALRGPVKDLYWVTAFVTEGDVARAKDFAARFKAAFGEEADVHAALAYEGLKLLNEAMTHTKDTLTLPRIHEELVQLKDYNGLTGPLSFAPDRQLRRPAFVVRLDGGTVKTVKRYSPDN